MRIYLTRHGESEYNVEDRIGGDPPLTKLGMEYGDALCNYASDNDLLRTVFCSPKIRTIQTIKSMQTDIKDLRIRDDLAEISA